MSKVVKGTSKKGVDVEKLREKRADMAVSLRKKQQQSQLEKKRREMQGDEGGEVEPCGDIPGLVQELFAPTSERQLQATILLRKQLSIEKDCSASIIDAIASIEGCIPRLVDFLKDSSQPQTQFEAAWALTNIASGTAENTHQVVASGALPVFAELIMSGNDNVREQSIWAIGNIAGDCAKFRDLILSMNVMHSIIHIIASGPNISLLRNAVWAMSNLCRGSPIPLFEYVKPALPVLADLLMRCQDEEVLIDSCWALSYISNGPDDRVDAVLASNVVPRLIQLLTQAIPTIQVPALRAVGNLVTGNDDQTQAVINCGVLPPLHFLLQSPKPTVRKETCWAISNITAGTTHQIQAVFTAGLIGPVIQRLQSAELQVKKEAAWVINNAASGGTPEQVNFLVQEGCIPALCELLTYADTKVLTVALEALDNILKVGQAAKEHTGNDNPFVQPIVQCGGMDRIEALQNHADDSIYTLVVSMLEKYFEVETIDVNEAEKFNFGQAPHPQGTFTIA
eukprot:TRINITY_DN1667_c0_g1_i1.p1 TRINITY_DN1667_c0_g1~~TRINITY_DN1667_c0_g1_i1.p1  ORF type:complete len:510 (+),score=168.02 TRINITY_DN1667_c0_g1_i1:593-2122(+)